MLKVIIRFPHEMQLLYSHMPFTLALIGLTSYSHVAND